MKLWYKCKNIILKLIIVICAITLIVIGFILLKDYLECKSNNNDIADLIDDVFVEDSDTNETTIDWEYLKSVNEDIIAWIEIENTSINYPILKDDENLYYLKHNYLKKYNSNGSIFTLNEKPFIDSETVIYGHNMKNGTMFSSFGSFLNKDYLLNHRIVKIYTPTANYEGAIFSCYSISVSKERSNIANLSFDERLEYYKNESQVKVDDIEITNKIIKLSTCSYLNSRTSPTDQRYYIIATLNEVN